MTILHVDTDSGWRGGQQLLLRLAVGLHGVGVPTVVACPPRGRLSSELKAQGVECVDIPAGRSLATVRRLKHVAPDLLVAHTSHAHGLCVMTGLPLVVHRWVDAPLSRAPWSRWKYRQPEAFVACSHAVKSVLEVGGVDPDRICVVYGGTVPPVAAPAADAPEVLAVGARVHHKGHDILAEAVAMLAKRGLHLDVAVAGEGPLTPPGLRWLGHRDDIGALLAGARLFVHPSRSEGLGMAVVEAMMAGVPVVASRVGGIPEVVGDDGVLVEAGCASSLADGIAAALRKPRSSGDTGRARVRQQFSTAAMVAGARRLYAEVLDANQ